MSEEPLDCARIRQTFVAGRVPAGPELAAHLEGCPECGELFANDAELGRSLGRAVEPEVEPGALFSLVEREVAAEVGPRARLRALPTGVRSSSLALLAGLLLVSQLALRPRANLDVYSPVVFWSVAVLLGAAVSFGALRLLRGPSAPLRSSRHERLLAPALLAAPVLATLLAPLGSAEAAEIWGRPAYCFAYGSALTLPVVLLYWSLERRDRPPTSALVAAGALSGTAANLLLHAHCGSAHPGHLLLGHVSIGAGWAAALGLWSRYARAAR